MYSNNQIYVVININLILLIVIYIWRDPAFEGGHTLTAGANKKMFALILLAVIASGASDETPYLFYFRPEGPDTLPGLYGGPLGGHMNANDLHQEVLTCAGQRKGLNISSMSYDAPTKKIHVLLDNVDKEKVTLIAADPCKSLHHHEHCAQEIIIDGKPRDGKMKIGPIAIHKGSIYFIARSCEDDTYNVEIRRLHLNCSYNNREFNVTECSDIVINLMRRRGCEESVDSFVPLEHLLVTTRADGQLAFLFQVLVGGATLELTRITEKGEVSIVSQSRPELKTDLSQISTAGGFAFRAPDVLCWSDITSVHCGNWTPDGPVRSKKQIVKPEEVVKVCGGLMDEKLQTLTTGVAIVNVSPLEVYFGCYGNTFGEGGAGRVKEVNSTYVVEPLKDNKGQLSAAAMVLAECPPEVSTSPPVVDAAATCQMLTSSAALLLLLRQMIF